jgi:hypothetical protein
MRRRRRHAAAAPSLFDAVQGLSVPARAIPWSPTLAPLGEPRGLPRI